ncbi:MAG TPA: hypothetical protein VGR29_13170 [Thermomicrobiales bacterium]|nr:hypothetical protein [Thermomicrobiales bacterium]
MFRSIRLLIVLALAIASLLLGSLQFAFADPDVSDAPVPLHRHYIVTSNGDRVEVGPRLCDDLDNPALRSAFNQFHSNLHIALPNSPGPAQSAPGLHDGRGAEITGVPGC